MASMDLDWRENKNLIMSTMNRLETRIGKLEELVRSEFKDIRKEMADMRSLMMPDVEKFVAEVWREARQADSEEIPKHKLEQLVNGHHKKSTWEPWQYVLLGAIIAVAGDRLVELALKVL